MASQKTNWTVIILLVVAAVGILFLSSKASVQNSNKVTMQEVFNQKPAGVADKDPVPSLAIVTSPEHGKEAGFAVQVYSFKDEKRADAALADLKKSGYKAYIEISDLGPKGIWYRVRIGNLENEAQAKAMLEKVRKDFNGGFIVKAKN